LPEFRYGWTAREKDVETHLQYNRARWYDAAIGRWVSSDPLGFEAGDSNLFRYVKNSPTTASDPSGLWNLFNPLTWGTRTPDGLSSFNPFGASAHWGDTAAGIAEGAVNELKGAREVVYTVTDLTVRPALQGGELLLYNMGAKSTLTDFEYKSQLLKGAAVASRDGNLAKYSATAGLETFKGGATLGLAPLVETGIEGYKTGDWTNFEMTAGGNLAGVLVGKASGGKNSVFYRQRPTYNLGGQLQSEFPGATNVQPKSFPGVPEAPFLIVEDASALPIRSGSANIYSQNTPIGVPRSYLPGRPYSIKDIFRIAQDGGTVTVLQGAETPGMLNDRARLRS
jgi:RHS repeat-associated protein